MIERLKTDRAVSKMAKSGDDVGSGLPDNRPVRTPIPELFLDEETDALFEEEAKPVRPARLGRPRPPGPSDTFQSYTPPPIQRQHS